MAKALSDSQIEQYHEEGFLSPIDVMSEDEAVSYRQRFEAAEAQYPEQANPHNRNNVHLSYMCLDELVHHPSILNVVEDLIGAHFSLWASVMFIKEPSTAHYVSWHQDATYMGLSKHNFVTPWLALSPSNRETGCMSMIPGSHRNHIRQHEDTFAEDNILTRGQVVRDVDESLAVDLILRPGQMSLHHAEIVHGSQANTSSERRIGFAMQSYVTPDVRQTVGENYWLDIRGENTREDSTSLHRPRFDLDPVAQADREEADANLSKILYHGAAQKRGY